MPKWLFQRQCCRLEIFVANETTNKNKEENKQLTSEWKKPKSACKWQTFIRNISGVATLAKDTKMNSWNALMSVNQNKNSKNTFWGVKSVSLSTLIAIFTGRTQLEMSLIVSPWCCRENWHNQVTVLAVQA